MICKYWKRHAKRNCRFLVGLCIWVDCIISKPKLCNMPAEPRPVASQSWSRGQRPPQAKHMAWLALAQARPAHHYRSSSTKAMHFAYALWDSRLYNNQQTACSNQRSRPGVQFMDSGPLFARTDPGFPPDPHMSGFSGWQELVSHSPHVGICHVAREQTSPVDKKNAYRLYVEMRCK